MRNSGSDILRAVAAPETMLGAEPALAKASAVVGAATFLLTGLDGFYLICGFAGAHVVALLLTRRDPDTSRVFNARRWVGRARALRRVKGNLYVA